MYNFLQFFLQKNRSYSYSRSIFDIYSICIFFAALRTSWANAESVSDKAKLDGELSTTLKTIMAVSESYPELKANQNFSELSEELRNTENKISFARQFYNDSVTMYNTKLQVFPSNIIAGMFNFTPRDLFKAESDEARKNVKVDFSK